MRRVLDDEAVDVFVTGSSAALLSREIATALRGRAWAVLIHPFSFEEALRRRGGETAPAMDAKARSAVESALVDYLTVGGFPEVQGFDQATRYRVLQDYVDIAILVRTIWLAAESERRRMVNPRKAYPVDPGLIGLFDRSGRANIGHALETAVLLELERRRAQVSYVKTPNGLEVDFLARYPSGETELIQACANAGAPQTAERELRSLVEAGVSFPEARKLLLTLTADGLPRRLPADVEAIPAGIWLLPGPPRGR